jgi:hypothetical protein
MYTLSTTTCDSQKKEKEAIKASKSDQEVMWNRPDCIRVTDIVSLYSCHNHFISPVFWLRGMYKSYQAGELVSSHAMRVHLGDVRQTPFSLYRNPLSTPAINDNRVRELPQASRSWLFAL